MSWYNGVVPAYYPTSDPREADAAYAAWQAHCSRWPYSHTVYQIPPHGVWQYQNPNYTYGYPILPQPAYHTWMPEIGMPEQKSKKKEKRSEDSDDNDDNLWANGQTARESYWVGGDRATLGKEKNNKKMDKKDESVEYVAHYIPAGMAPQLRDGIHSDGKYHYNFYGRSAAEVHEDRHRQAVDSGVFRPRKKIPDAAPNDQFWVYDTKTRRTELQSFGDIQKNYKGEWKVDDTPGAGNDYFKMTGKKAPVGWDSD